MMIYNYIYRSFRHYLGRNILVALGVAVSTAVLTGALIIGDSVKHSLEQTTFFRLGKVTHVVSVTDRYFKKDLAVRYQHTTGFPTAPVLILEGIAVADGGQQRVNKVQITGIDSTFLKVTGVEQPFELSGNEVMISENLALRLSVKEGDAILVRIEKASLIPKNAPFVSDTETTVTLRATIKGIAGKEQMGHFNLKNSQSAPYNLFISIERLNRLMEFEDRANGLLISADNAGVLALYEALKQNISPDDGNLVLRQIPLTGDMEVSSERVFMEDNVAHAFISEPGAKPVLTYFVNSITRGNLETPYSFVASMPGTGVPDDGIIINQWMANDLQAKPGDTLRMAYFEIGPLRQLEEKEVPLIVKEIVPIEGAWADGDLMPHLPGLSDAGHCREWEAGVPIVLDKIRDKDEDYWDRYKGVPKAFISPALGQKLWANRFGSYTAIRLPGKNFTESRFQALFHENIYPEHIGFSIQAVREDGLRAAGGGVDFSDLFLGLSFFLLLAAIILSSLMFRLNLEGRGWQTGTLMQLGFKNRQIAWMIFAEALLSLLAGTALGLVLAVGYTRLVFNFLNTLWWEIVRTDVLFIAITPATLLTGAIISLTVALISIALPVKRFLQQRVAELHRAEASPVKKWKQGLKKWAAILLPLFSLSLLIWQLISGESRNPAIFFAAGGLLLPGLLLWADRWVSTRIPYQMDKFSLDSLSVRNLSRNKNRSVSVIILFALGTFLVVSTGANRQDMFSGAANKTSGTGGYQYFAEASVPVLYDLNDAGRRQSEGLPGEFTAVQFHRIEGDDASCLNLNRISNPAVLGTNPEQLSGRFSFVAHTPELDRDNPWLSLNQTLEGGVVPAIADQTVIQWGLGLKVGDILMYQDEKGDTLKLKLIGGLAPSVFQGYLIISGEHFLRHYPSHSGSSVFLLETEESGAEETANELQLLLRDNGWEMTFAPRRLAEFYSVTNTYLSIFLALGALGLALGTIGLALVLARSVMERRRELGIFQAVGFKKKSVINLLAREYGRLLLAGVGIGFLSAILATLPSILSENTSVSFMTIFWVVGGILVNGFLWIYLLAALMVKPAELVESLRDE